MDDLIWDARQQAAAEQRHRDRLGGEDTLEFVMEEERRRREQRGLEKTLAEIAPESTHAEMICAELDRRELIDLLVEIELSGLLPRPLRGRVTQAIGKLREGVR